jgi:hypothetical protein
MVSDRIQNITNLKLSKNSQEVGPKTAPAAMIALVSPTFKMYAISIPSPIGIILPKKAMINPRVPINFSVDKSISIPASKTSKIKLEI